MITKVWGSINGVDVVFTQVEDRPGYWEAIGPRVEGLQNIVIWAETEQGSTRRLAVSVAISWNTDTTVRLLLVPIYATLYNSFVTSTQKGRIRGYFLG